MTTGSNGMGHLLRRQVCYGICLCICHNEGGPMSIRRRARLFKNGRSQAVRIPRELEFPGDEVIIRKEGRRLIIEPAPPRESLLDVLARFAKEGPLPESDRLPKISDRPPEPVEI